MAKLHSFDNRFYGFFTAYFYFVFAVIFGCLKKECICEPVG